MESPGPHIAATVKDRFFSLRWLWLSGTKLMQLDGGIGLLGDHSRQGVLRTRPCTVGQALYVAFDPSGQHSLLRTRPCSVGQALYVAFDQGASGARRRTHWDARKRQGKSDFTQNPPPPPGPMETTTRSSSKGSVWALSGGTQTEPSPLRGN